MIAEQLECDQLRITRKYITTLIDLMDDLSLTNTTSATNTAAAATVTLASNHRPCLHGSTSDHFSDGRAYKNVIKEYLMVSLLTQEDGWREKFDADYLIYLADLNFAQYIFALCTSWYLKMNGTSPELNDLILLAVRIKCILFPKYSEEGDEKPDYTKFQRYYRAIDNNDERGVINCLSKETKSYCNCMKDKKTEADGMEKTDKCFGCKHSFPRSDMKKCSGCKFAMFCTNEDCYEKHWPAHREYCKDITAAREEF